MNIVPPPPTPSTPIEDARAWVQNHRDDGVPCPCCDQFCKVYKREITASMAQALIEFYKHALRHPEEEWMHIPTICRDRKVCPSNMAALLRHWDLIWGKTGERDDGSKRIGFYRMTALGESYVQGRESVQQYVLLYNQMVLGFDGPRKTILDALGTKFDYQLLMER